MLEKLKPKSEFAKNVLTLMTGTTIAQAIPIAISPILTRLYSPEDFGVFALYFAVSSIFASIVAGRYELAIMLPRGDIDGANVVMLSVLVSFVVSFALLMVVVFFNEKIAILLKTPEIVNWLYFIPLSVLLVGLYQSLYYWHNRKKQYDVLSYTKIIESSSSAFIKIFWGFLVKIISGGLIIGAILSKVFAVFFLIFQVKKRNSDKFHSVRFKKIFVLAKRYKNFPRHLIVSHWIGSVYMQIPIFAINNFFAKETLGFFLLLKG